MVRKSKGSESEMVLRLREAIQADGRSLNQLAKDSGLDAGRLSRFLRGERDINFEAASRLCEILGIKFTLPEPPSADAQPRGRGRPPKAQDTPTAPPRRRTGKKMPGKAKRPPKGQ